MTFVITKLVEKIKDVTWPYSSTILPSLIGFTIAVHNEKQNAPPKISTQNKYIYIYKPHFCCFYNYRQVDLIFKITVVNPFYFFPVLATVVEITFTEKTSTYIDSAWSFRKIA